MSVQYDLSNRNRRVVDGRVEIYIPCPQMCHGFGVCVSCGNAGGYWRRPSPRYQPFRGGFGKRDW